MSNELTIHEKDLAEIKQGMGLTTASDFDFKKLISICQTYGLDPRLNQISAWVQNTKDGPKMIIHTTVDGWYEIANRQATFDGIESGVVYQGDIFTQKDNGSFHLERKSQPNAAVIGAYSVVYRKDRKIPTLKYVRFCEFYRDNSPIWKSHPSAMIEKVAISRAIKASFSISGIYSEEEVETMKADNPNIANPQAQQQQPTTGPKQTELTWDEQWLMHINPSLSLERMRDWHTAILDEYEGEYESIGAYTVAKTMDNEAIKTYLEGLAIKYGFQRKA